jgi:hypothetical protein
MTGIRREGRIPYRCWLTRLPAGFGALIPRWGR